MAESTHKVEVVKLGPIQKHPNADSLGIATIGGYSCCVRLGDLKEGDLVAYIQPDSVVDTTKEQFAFLGDHARIKVKKLRGIISQGLLIHAPEGSMEGDNVADILGVTHYNPPEPISISGDQAQPPDGYHPTYDVESYYNYPNLFVNGELVVVSEKVHGTSARYYFDGTTLHVGSRTTWLKETESSAYWKALRQHPELEQFLRQNPGITAYGEVYGWVQDLRYGHTQGKVNIALFDLLRGTKWLDIEEVQEITAVFGLPWVPYSISTWSPEVVKTADGISTVAESHGAKQIREDIVVKPVEERTCLEIGRVQLKIVSNDYLAR